MMEGYFLKKMLKLTLSTACVFQVLSSKRTCIQLVCKNRRGGRREEGEMGVSEGFMGVIMESQWLAH